MAVTQRFHDVWIRKKEIIGLIFIVVAVFVLTVLEYRWLAEKFSGYTYDMIYDLKKKHIEDIVDNTIINIEERQNILREAYEQFPEDHIEEMLEDDLRKWIYASDYNDSSYIWVNKILNYDGGDDYAIRLIHANEQVSEGIYLSTNSQDAVGNYPYLNELEEIKKSGEVYQVYQFQKKSTGEAVMKLAYAKLYKDYDWVICMGVDIDEIEKYTEQIQNHIQSMLIVGIIAVEFIVIVVFLLIFHYKKKQFTAKSDALISKLNVDYLTGAGSRRYGEWLLARYWEYCKKGDSDTIVAMLDIDHFKHINDTYGHEIGDYALREFVNAIEDVVKSQGIVIRWGGDEFIVILPGYQLEKLEEIGERLLQNIQKIEIKAKKERIHMTSSIGFAAFHNTDQDYNDVVRRVDDALYHAKSAGRNQYVINIRLED